MEFPKLMSTTAVRRAYQTLLGRDPELESVILNKILTNKTEGELHRELQAADEYQEKSSPWGLVISNLRFFEFLPGVVFAHFGSLRHQEFLLLRHFYCSQQAAWLRGSLRADSFVLDWSNSSCLFGLFMANLLGPGGTVVSLAGSPEELFLRDRAALANKFGSRFQTLSKWGEGSYQHPPSAYGLGGIKPSLGTEPFVSLDDCRWQRPIDLVRIDMNGAEGLVIDLAEDTLRRYRPAVLISVNLDQLSAVSKTNNSKLTEQMEDIGYRISQSEQFNNQWTALYR